MATENPTQTSESLNSLAQASSSYLRSAMHQPIHWHEWGEAAFAAAKQQNKPVLLDIGAVWCHWCHVMDRESYENPEVAQIINEHFVAVKVDRDERPDVDSRYQAAVSAISGQGGWPLTAFLTPEGKPFYGGTYFPPEDHYGRPGLKRVLLSIAQAYREKHGEVIESADSVMSAISHAEAFTGRSAEFSPELVDKIVSSAAKLFDVQHGGFGSEPKFPHPAIMDLLIDRYARTRADFLGTIINTTLEKMAQGGVYDQLAGGFHRYSVDERWIVPHFEKMSYDNAGLLLNYVHGYQATRNVFFAEVASDIIRWMDEWLSDRERGGFYGSQDADINLDDDGDYFTWTVTEAAACLSEDEFKVAALHYDIGEVGEMHHNHEKNVLYIRAAKDEISQRLGLPQEKVNALLASAKKKMYAARLQRPTPYIDKTIYVNWNALAISAYLSAAQALKMEAARDFALKSLDRILSQAWNPKKGMGHVIAYSDPRAEVRHVPGMLDDYAYMVSACLDAYEATSDLHYFTIAGEIGDAMITRFYDPTSGGFFDTEITGENRLGALAARRKPFQDAPTPAADPSAAIAMLRLHAYTNDPNYREKAEQTLEVFAGLAEQYGMFAGTYGIAAAMFSAPHTQVVILEKNSDGAAANQLYDAAIESFVLNKSVLRIAEGKAIPENLPPAMAETIPNLPAVKEKKTVAVVCSEFACKPPVSDVEELRKILE
ncbi:MAG TPA: thioredoxin domain-containing protein [Terriglobales bacterium]|nr:thioredoxin domain-containing protein [Terriglobales bacterium]